MINEYFINACSGKCIYACAGQHITVEDIHGEQVVDFFAENSENPNEFLSTGVTIDCNESLRLNVEIIFIPIFIGQCSKSYMTKLVSTICCILAAALKCMIFLPQRQRAS